MSVNMKEIQVVQNPKSCPLFKSYLIFYFLTLYLISLGMCLADETAVLLLYALVHGNSDFLEYVLVRTDIDTLLMPLLETLYDASRRTSNQMLLLMLSQSFLEVQKSNSALYS
ncbi:unnamed protein product [Lactuca virosa]|uniref:Dymeclin n=1 Tax=Lactuca virosa TaxID=75947 RepID=A0AAU9N6U5_9ASTR|nr:unnamed protein product [Lactuca virosa]